jgi:hypothetical protein
MESWKNSYHALASALDGLPAPMQECSVYLEFGMPSSSTRADVLLAGLDPSGKRAAIVIELKQWTAETITIHGNTTRAHGDG